ncbi:MAG: glycosyltransferase family 2 protein [Thiobacillus sp.]|nr:glycosyltransferase family 2 protein [Thiobacillus sp.]
MFYKYRNQWARWRFERHVRGVLDTPPIRLGGAASPTLLSQLQHKDVSMYLAAVKSFAAQLPPREVHIVDDGSLTEQDRALLRQHVPGVCFHRLVDCREPGLPTGGTWERLIAIARLSADRYAIQLDADTLTLGPLDEIAQAVREGQSFSIGTWDGQTLETTAERASTARAHLNAPRPHVQVLAESNFDAPGMPARYYIRGCSGFSGLAPGTGKLEFMLAASRVLQERLGERWSEWGSEQVMSNLLVANQPRAIVLPHPRYTDCEKMRPGETRFVHFIGTCRFRRGVYADSVRRVLLRGAA